MQIKSNFTAIASDPLLLLTLFCLISVAIILISLFWMYPTLQMLLRSSEHNFTHILLPQIL